MSNSHNSSSPEIPDKQQLYGHWWLSKKWLIDRLDWQSKLEKSLAHKSVDVPEDMPEMAGISANKEMVVNNSGLSPAWLLALAALTMGGLYFYSQRPTDTPAATSTQSTDEQIRKEVIERNLKLRLFHNGREVVATPKGQ